MQSLPIDAHLKEIQHAVRLRRCAVVVAPPGAGKTTRVLPALLELGRAILLQPRRVAARSIARRIASEQGWTLGQEVGWQVRFDRRFGRNTRLLVATEGILTSRLVDDPLLEEFGVVVLDEMHERSIHADLALALARQAAHARDDLHLIVMSATLDAGPIAEYLGGAPIIEVPGQLHPVTIEYSDRTLEEEVVDRLRTPGGHLLCFLPGAGEIRRSCDALAPRVGNEARVLPLHGSLSADDQDAALAPSKRRKVVLATNLAETSLTIEGITDVVDGGRVKMLRHDPARGIDRLETERVTRDSADQRAGRAGRTGPGRAVRLWDPDLRLKAHREPEIMRVDLASTFLDILAWGGDPRSFPWLQPPAPAMAAAAWELLAQLGATKDARLTGVGRKLRRIPLHPRLGRVLLASGGSELAAAACAVLSEPDFLRGEIPTTSSDVLTRIEKLARAPGSIRDAARQLAEIGRRLKTGSDRPGDEEQLRRALLAGYPDRVAQRRAPKSPRLKLARGHGAVLTAESGVRDGDYLLALDLMAGPRGPGSEARVRLASSIDVSWLTPTRQEVVHRLDPDGVVRALHRSYYGTLLLDDRPTEVDPDAAARVLADELIGSELDAESELVRRRLAFAGIDIDLPALLATACAGRTRLPTIDLGRLLPPDVRSRVDRLAPASLPIPSGRRARLDYRPDGEAVLSVKLQELFGLTATPRIGPDRTPVLIELLAPNGRPVQTTADLASFWTRTYPEVRKELRGRYPRHPWPEDPLTAEPTGRPTRRRRGR